MKYVFQMSWIVLFCFLGEVLHALLPLPIPASVYGLVLLLVALRSGLLKLSQVRETGTFLTGIFPILFVPAATGVMEYMDVFRQYLIPVILAAGPVTWLVMGVAGRVTQALAKGGKRNAV